MHIFKKALIFCLLLLVSSGLAYGEDVTREQVKGLDEQVQEIKGDMLAIAAELNQLEEKLLYPSHTQISVFLSLAKDEKLRLDAVDLLLDGQAVTHHLYSFKELEALRKGGVQRLYTGNVTTGEHSLQVKLSGKSGGGSDLALSENFKVLKGIGPRIVEVTLANQGITLSDR